VLIGSDAYRVDRIQRLFPARASAMFAAWLARRRGKEGSAAAANASRTV
jgi:hypothetical protein